MSVKSRQEGMTLVEVLIVSAITAVLVGGLTTAIFMTVSATGRGNDETSALRDLQSAAYWISTDCQMAATTDLSEGEEVVDALNLQWTGSSGESHSSGYSLCGSELQRDYDGAKTTLAWYVSSVEFSISGNVVTFYVESTPPGRWQVSRQMTGSACLRPGG